MRNAFEGQMDVPVYSDWDEEHILDLLKHVLDHQELPPGTEEDEKAALAARLIYIRKEPDGHRTVRMSMLGEIFFCDLVCRKNGEN